MPLPTHTASLDEAGKVLDTAKQAAAEMGVKAAIVILDAGGDLLLAARMDGAWPGAIDLALAKANVSRAFVAPSGQFTPLVQPGAPLFGVGSTAAGKYLPLPGGYPLFVAETLAGAIGVSGGSPDQDAAIAEAAAAVLTLA